jgi:glucosamine-6-phosphate deaminase
VLVFSPEPYDAVASMGGTLDRLVRQGHEVRVVCQTSGNLLVSDVAAHKFASVIQEMKALGRAGWGDQVAYGAMILEQLEKKGAFGEDPEEVRQLKGLILRGEARAAVDVCGIAEDAICFLDLPFYEKGRYRQFSLTEADVDLCVQELEGTEPHQIYATGHIADPSSVQALCFAALKHALKKLEQAPWRADCRIWLYRGKETSLGIREIDMAVPMSPDQLALKAEATRKYQSVSIDESLGTAPNVVTAVAYDALGMAEYEAIEAFERVQNNLLA